MMRLSGYLALNLHRSRRDPDFFAITKNHILY